MRVPGVFSRRRVPVGLRWRAGLFGSDGDTIIDRAPSTGFAAFQR